MNCSFKTSAVGVILDPERNRPNVFDRSVAIGRSWIDAIKVNQNGKWSGLEASTALNALWDHVDTYNTQCNFDAQAWSELPVPEADELDELEALFAASSDYTAKNLVKELPTTATVLAMQPFGKNVHVLPQVKDINVIQLHPAMEAPVSVSMVQVFWAV